ncbi:MAG: thioredoxin family protein [Microbacteriaceae bacterium]|uniref:thioredoxin family protein n=1 Tax=Microbacterium sp. TaxID=51671 RepID=UPI003F9DFD85
MSGPRSCRLAAEYDGRIKIVNLDADQNPDMETAAGATSIPTLGFYKNGVRTDILIGAHPNPVIAEKMDPLLA